MSVQFLRRFCHRDCFGIRSIEGCVRSIANLHVFMKETNTDVLSRNRSPTVESTTNESTVDPRSPTTWLASPAVFVALLLRLGAIFIHSVGFQSRLVRIAYKLFMCTCAYIL
jgi:hypothetical protein